MLDDDSIRTAQQLIESKTTDPQKLNTVFPAINNDKPKETVNISSTGIAFDSPFPMSSGSKLALTLQLKENSPYIYAVSTIIRSEKKDNNQHLIFNNFSYISAEDQEKILAYTWETLDKQRKS